MDCNILFSFEIRISTQRGSITELQLSIERELDHLRKIDHAVLDQDF